uniref:Protein kinase-like domain, concanavalin A-like lectin/glucanase domain protein n=1 Tax=Tanacetum cinerariifolium TaxID=118510 RepID=A0A6L2NM47_TANCI|nr:protein kinase-like domain, concanavalin A-like lectin/glucanase domain protein [Tanacetum cinerariifolium]
MEAHLAPNPHGQVNKIASSCEICSGPHDTQYCMENFEQAFVEYASSHADEVEGKWMQYNWIMRKKIKPREDLEDFMIVKDISLIIDPGLSQVVLGRSFVEVSNMTHDLSIGVVKFIVGNDEIAFMIKQYNSLSNLEKEQTKSVCFRNQEDKRNGVDYVMNKILGFYKGCLELGPEYLTGLEDKG